ncbi:antibiotic biosynthesis monooxygenase family protein [Corynebacterium mastitidis]|uniref:Antibiotic biosynthesis monooxygenase n=2 Tax=Corynebacterium mastitidis TaxID=161890 RepID=A0A2N0X5R8_9CORY|nr:antibiotic biosynthesis monooxygenase [Corynebacterium mastitidis]PKF68040.1 antibiotic biosynthesis monooxygenase [Corynebacterium mastitidis]
MSIVKINALTVPAEAAATLEERFAARKHSVDSAPGFEGFQLLRPTAGEERYFVVTWWKDEASYADWRDHRAAAAHGEGEGQERRRPAATNAELLEFEVVLDSRAEDAGNSEGVSNASNTAD